MSGAFRPRKVSILLLLLAIAVGLAWQFARPARTNVFAQTINRPLPPLDLAPGRTGSPRLTEASLASGKPQLINLFASWCVPCIAEAQQLMTLKREGIAITGIAVRDRPQAVAAFLEQHGDPYAAIGLDDDSKAQLALGAAGVPETFVVDGNGMLIRRFIGGLDESVLPDVRRALAEAATATPAFQSHEADRHAFFGSFTPAERWLILADSYARTGDKHGAVGAIRAGLRTRPDDAVLLTGLGSALVDEAGRLTPEAANIFAKAIALAPSSSGPRYFLGAAMFRSGDRAGARAQWTRLLARAPPNASWRPLVEEALQSAPPTGAGMSS